MKAPADPLPLPGWDDPWPLEGMFQAVAHYLARRYAGAGVHVLDTSAVAYHSPHGKGAPDLVASVDGRMVEIELKAAGGRLRRFQVAERERCEISGGEYAVCRTMREVFAALGMGSDVPDRGVAA